MKNLKIPLLIIFNCSFGSENHETLSMPSPEKTWEQAKQFESSRILQDVGYKLTDDEIREHIYAIHKKAPDAYSYFCKKIEKKRNKIQENLFNELHKIVDDLGIAEFKNKLATIKKYLQ